MKSLLAVCLCLLAAHCGLLQARMINAVPADALRQREHGSLDEDVCPPSTIVSLPLTITGNTSTSQANYQLTCPDYNPAFSPDDIYALSLSCRTQVTVSLCGSGYDTVVEVRHGTNYFDCPGSTVIVCNDDYCGLQSQLSFFAEIGDDYFIIISGYGGASGPYTMNVSGVSYPPLNDNCPGFLITSLPYTDFGSTTCSSNGGYYLPPCVNTYTGGVVYTLNLPCAAWITATTCGHPLMDAVLSVRTGGSCPGTTPVVCNDDACAYYQSSVSFNASPNTPYYIFVDGWGSNRGYYVLSVTGSTGPDACPGDYLIQLPVYINSDTRCGNNDYAQCTGGDANDDVYTFNVQQCTQVTASMCGTNTNLFDPVIEVRSGAGCPGDVSVVCLDDGTCGGSFSLAPTVTFFAQPGPGYYILVGGYGGSAGAYFLSVTGTECAPPQPVTDLVAQANLDVGTIELNWSAVASASSYNVYASGSNCNPGELCNLIGTTQGTSFSDDAGLGGSETVRFYQVTAVNGAQPHLLLLAGKRPPVPLPTSAAATFEPPVQYDYTASAQKPKL